MAEIIPTTLFYRNDFIVRLRFEDVAGHEVDINPYDWEARFFTALAANFFTARHTPGGYEHARAEGRTVIVALDNHGLLSGDLKIDFSADIPARSYPDGKAHIALRQYTGIRLSTTAGASASVSVIHTVTIRLPLLESDLIPGEPDDPEKPGGNCPCGCDHTAGNVEPLTDDDIAEIIAEISNP